MSRDKLRLVVKNTDVTTGPNSERVQALHKEANSRVLVDRDYVIYAYYFNKLGNPLLAQKYLNKISKGYFVTNVYKDAFQSLLVWTVLQQNAKYRKGHWLFLTKYFFILKRCLESFENLEFDEKANWHSFRTNFLTYVRFSTT